MPFLAALLPAVAPALIGGAAAIGASLIGKSTADANRAAQEKTNARVDEFGRPYREAGTNALSQLDTAYGFGDPATLAARRAQLTTDFEASPLYKYTYQPAVDEATKAAERNASAGGFLNSGRTIKAIQDRAARIGGQTFGNYLGGLSDMAHSGQQAAFGSGAQTMQGQNALAGYTTQGGDALGAGVLGVGSAAQQGFENFYKQQGASAYGTGGVGLSATGTGGLY